VESRRRLGEVMANGLMQGLYTVRGRMSLAALDGRWKVQRPSCHAPLGIPLTRLWGKPVMGQSNTPMGVQGPPSNLSNVWNATTLVAFARPCSSARVLRST